MVHLADTKVSKWLLCIEIYTNSSVEFPEEYDIFFFGDANKQAKKRSIENHNFIFEETKVGA